MKVESRRDIVYGKAYAIIMNPATGMWNIHYVPNERSPLFDPLFSLHYEPSVPTLEACIRAYDAGVDAGERRGRRGLQLDLANLLNFTLR